MTMAEYFSEFHWWYLIVAYLLYLKFFGKGGGRPILIVKEIVADLQILDERFHGCDTEARYMIFKQGKPHRIKIEVDDLTIPVGAELVFRINGKLLSVVEVVDDNGEREAEFEHWSDGDVLFPEINAGDELTIEYEETEVIRGVFQVHKV